MRTIKKVVKRIIPKGLYAYMKNMRRRNRVLSIGNKLLKSDNEEFRYYGELINKEDELQVYYGEWTKKWKKWDFDLLYDDPYWYAEYRLLVGEGKKKLYFREDWDKEKCRMWYKSIVMEQDQDSPHCYFNEGFFERNNLFGTVLDIGCAEGNFSLSVIDKVDKVFYFEPDIGWKNAIGKTFKDYEEKLIWVKKAVGERSEGEIVSIDEFFADRIPTDISLIKMDIDGYEPNALKGMKKTLELNPDATLLICAYHHLQDEKEITHILSEMGYGYKIRKGYMLFPEPTGFQYPYLRRGVIEAKMEMNK